MDAVQQKSTEKQKGLNFVTALIILSCFALGILCLCGFGCLGSDEEFEVLIANQIRESILRKQRRELTSAMNESANDQFLPSHYEQNVTRQQQLQKQNYLEQTY